jgi:hypothetical protein
MISNDYHLELAKAELAKRRRILGELEAARASLPRTHSARAGTHRVITIRQEIRELDAEIQYYEEAKQHVLVNPPAHLSAQGLNAL